MDQILSYLVAALVAGTPCAMVAAIAVMRFMGKRLTSALDNYGAETAKIVAQAHNIELLVEQNKAITSAAETIKSQLSSASWDRPTQWTFRKDIYVRLLEGLGRLSHASLLIKSSFGQVRLRPNDNLAIELLAKASEMYTTATAEWSRALDVAPLVISKESYLSLEPVLAAARRSLETQETIEVRLDDMVAAIAKAAYTLQIEAKKDLGYGASDWQAGGDHSVAFAAIDTLKLQGFGIKVGVSDAPSLRADRPGAHAALSRIGSGNANTISAGTPKLHSAPRCQVIVPASACHVLQGLIAMQHFPFLPSFTQVENNRIQLTPLHLPPLSRPR